MTMKNISRYFFIGMLMILGPGFFPADSIAQMDLLDSPETSKQYLLNISGTVMNETFTGSQALLTLMPPAIHGSNPYQIIIGGFPKKNSRNSFYWNSEHSEMTANSNDITCDIKRTAVKPPQIYFVFLIPEMLKHTGVLELLGDEGRKAAEKVALPPLIYAVAGKLKLRIHSTSVSGTVWIKGYNRTEKAYPVQRQNTRASIVWTRA